MTKSDLFVLESCNTAQTIIYSDIYTGQIGFNETPFFRITYLFNLSVSPQTSCSQYSYTENGEIIFKNSGS